MSLLTRALLVSELATKQLVDDTKRFYFNCVYGENTYTLVVFNTVSSEDISIIA